MTVTLSAALGDAAARLCAAGVPDAMGDARVLAAAALSIRREDMLREPHRPLTCADSARFRGMIDRRAAREPVSRILGRREFRSLDFALDPATLDPRPDSETVVEAALALAARGTARCRVLDIGTGTGCLLLAILAALPGATGVGTDISPAAAATAARNAVRLGLSDRARFVVCNWTDGLAGAFDLVVSNPPYIAAAELAALPPEVALYDPPRALAGGADGLDAYRALGRRLGPLLAPGGTAIIEIGAGQETAVIRLFGERGLVLRQRRNDLAGRVRSLAFGA